MSAFQRYIGIMSGTSMDGADAVLIRMDGSRWLAAEAHAFTPYPAELKTRLLELQNSGRDELHRSQLLSLQLSGLYAQTVNRLLAETGLQPADIAAIGCHGQTVRHAPQQGYSIQLLNPAALAAQTSIDTVADFRSGDLAAGGQGAPLVPAFHQALFAHPQQMRVLLNIGGIANISVLPPNEDAFGFDTGAGNMLLDAWSAHIWQQPYDADGRLAAQGRVLPELLAKLCAHPYFSQPYPKSTGRELFSLDWLLSHLTGREPPHDVLRTLVQFSADTIAQAIFQAAPHTRQLYVCGGGIRNPVLIDSLKQHLIPRGIGLSSTAELQLDPQWMEAAAFAWLAAYRLLRLPANPPRATGAVRHAILGAVYCA